METKTFFIFPPFSGSFLRKIMQVGIRKPFTVKATPTKIFKKSKIVQLKIIRVVLGSLQLYEKQLGYSVCMYFVEDFQ